MMPKQQEIEIPLLRTIRDFGGQAPAHKVYAAITSFFSQLTEADLSESLPSGGNKWTNRIQWARQALVSRGELASGGHGIWSITGSGIARLERESATPAATLVSGERQPPDKPVSSSSSVPAFNLEDVAEDYIESFKEKVLNRLLDLTPAQFEAFAGTLLKGYGFQKVVVSGKSGDGGIDGHGQLRVGMAAIRAAFQCKRWQGSVGSKDVQAFRGAIQGQFEQGYFFTTSTFTKAAQDESIKMGAAPIILFEGPQIVDIMIEKGIGIRRRPVEVYEDQLDQLFES
jgi:restriction system protein